MEGPNSKKQFLQNHGATVSKKPVENKLWNTGTVDFHSKFKRQTDFDSDEFDDDYFKSKADKKKLSDLELQIEVNNQRKIKQGLSKQNPQDPYEKSTQRYLNKVEQMKKSQQKELEELDRMQIEAIYRMPDKKESSLKRKQEEAYKDIAKWKGTGLEQDIFNEYVDPMSRKRDIVSGPQYPISKEPLFQKSNTKSYYTLDGNIQYDYANTATRQYDKQNTTTLSSTIRQSAQDKYMRENHKNKFFSLSKFFVLKYAPKQTQSVVKDIKGIYGANSMSVVSIEGKNKPKSTNLSLFNNEKQLITAQTQIPVVKDWFESLELTDRVLCLTTIDPQVVQLVKSMQQMLTKVNKLENGKFKLFSTIPSAMQMTKVGDRKPMLMRVSHTMQLMNSHAYRSTPEVIMAELELLKYIRITDTHEMHDTLTVKEDLVLDPSKFYALAKKIVGENFLKAPHENTWLQADDRENAEFETAAPLWFDMHNANSIASWILFYLERALYMQWQINVHGNFLDCRDSSNQPIIVSTDNKNILLKDELKPFWRNFCVDEQASDFQNVPDFIQQVRNRAHVEFNIVKQSDSSIDALHGGIAHHVSDQVNKNNHLSKKIEDFLETLELCIKNFETENNPQLVFSDLCMNTLKDAASLKDPKDNNKIANEYFFAIVSRPPTITAQSLHNVSIELTEKNIVMKMERFFVDCLREKITNDLKSHFTSTNKKLQKRKIKKLKEKEQKQEKERLAKMKEEEQTKKQEDEKITVKNSKAIELLLGTDNKEEPRESEMTKSDFQEMKKNKKKKNKHKGGSSTAQKESSIKEKADKAPETPTITIESKLPIKPSTPKQKERLNKKIDPQNYFQVMDHKYAVSLESQGQEQSSNISSEISGALPVSTAPDKFSRGGATNMTLSTNEESNKTKQEMQSTQVLKAAEQAMSNEEVFKFIKQYQPNQLGSSQLEKKHWQRKDGSISGMINELLSESSSKKDDQELHQVQNQIIEIGVSQNKLYAELEDLDSDKKNGSSKSSVKESNRIIQINKKISKVIPRPKIKDSDETSSADSEQDLLPDLYTNYQPEDNDSSDYDQGEEQEEESIDEDDSSVAFSKSNNQGIRGKERRTPVKKKRQSQSKGARIGESSKSHKKSIKSANPKVTPINFYPTPNLIEEQIIEPDAVIEPEKFKNRWTQIKRCEAFTIQRIELVRVLPTIESKDPKKDNKKSKKQRKLEWEANYAKLQEIQPKQIEIIKPSEVGDKVTEVQTPTEKPEKKKKDEKKVVDPNSILAKQQAMNEFMKKMHGAHEQEKEVQKVENKKQTAKKEPEKPKQMQMSKQLSEQPKQPQPLQGAKKDLPEKKSKITDQKSTKQEQRLSSAEEAKVLGSGFHYQAKKQTGPNPEQPTKKQPEIIVEENCKKPEKKELENKSAPVKVLQEEQKSQLNLASKEYTIPTKNLSEHSSPLRPDSSIAKSISPQHQVEGQQQPPQPEVKPKKKKQKRSQKNKKNRNLMQNEFVLDPVIGQQILLTTEASFNQQNGMFNPIGGSPFMINPQVQELFKKLNEQVIAQQQAQIAEYQLKQQQEAENQLQEDCEPCNDEIDPHRYEQYFEQLTEEMKKKVKEIDQFKDSVRKERQGFIQIIENIVKDTFSNKYGNGYVGIKLFGSMATELAIETSDVDLVVTGLSQLQNYSGSREYNGKMQLLRIMQKLNDNLLPLKEKGLIFKMKFIQTASVPIIKLVADLQMINKQQINTALDKIKKEALEDADSSEEDKKSKSFNLSSLGLEEKVINPRVRYLKVDISIDEQTQQFMKFGDNYFQPITRSHSGVDAIYHIQSLLKQRADLRPIVMIIKKIFDETFLSMPYYGGISSYSLVLMVSAYLKRFDEDKSESLSRNLSGFFHFYGIGFKPHLYFLNGDQIEFCDDPMKRPFGDPFIVLDPMDKTNNISHSTFRIRDIQRALVKAFKIINLSCEQYQLQQNLDTCSPRQVINRLMNDIKEEYQYSASYDDI